LSNIIIFRPDWICPYVLKSRGPSSGFHVILADNHSRRQLIVSREERDTNTGSSPDVLNETVIASGIVEIFRTEDEHGVNPISFHFFPKARHIDKSHFFSSLYNMQESQSDLDIHESQSVALLICNVSTHEIFECFHGYYSRFIEYSGYYFSLF
jgi:hypothetical protein